MSPSSIFYILTSWILPLKSWMHHNYSTVGSNTPDAVTIYNSFIHSSFITVFEMTSFTSLCSAQAKIHLLYCYRVSYFWNRSTVVYPSWSVFQTFKLWGPSCGRWIFISFSFTFDKNETPSHSQRRCRHFFTRIYRGKAWCLQKSINDLSCWSLKCATFIHPSRTCTASLLRWEAADSIRASRGQIGKNPDILNPAVAGKSSPFKYSCSRWLKTARPKEAKGWWEHLRGQCCKTVSAWENQI